MNGFLQKGILLCISFSIKYIYKNIKTFSYTSKPKLIESYWITKQSIFVKHIRMTTPSVRIFRIIWNFGYWLFWKENALLWQSYPTNDIIHIHWTSLSLHKKLCALFDILANYYMPLFFPFYLMWSIPVLVVYEHQVNKFQTLYLEAARGHLEAVNLAKTHSRWNKHPILLYICNVKSITKLKKGSL